MNTMIDELRKAIATARANQFENSDQLTLGQIIDRCETIAAASDKSGSRVVFDFEYAHPTEFDSWRGIYSEIACGFTFEGSAPSLAEFIDLAKKADGATFEGYKGGDNLMSRETPVWVANYGHSGSTAIVGVLDDGYQVVLQTAYISP